MRKAGIVVAGLLLTLAATRGAQADGTIILTDVADFQNYINGTSHGTLNGLNANGGAGDPALTAILDAFHLTPNANAPISTNLDASNGAVPGLISYSNGNGSSPGSVGGWSFRYLADPDLTTGILNAQILVPQASSALTQSGINDVTISLVDTSDHVASWSFNNIVNPGELSAGSQDLSVVFGQGAAGGGDIFSEDAGFSLANVQDFVLSYRGLAGSTYPDIPSDGLTGLWMNTQSIDLTVGTAAQTPEPGALPAFCIGFGGLLAMHGALRYRRGR